MKLMTATLALVALVALAMGLTATFAKDGENIVADLFPNSSAEAGCQLGEVSLPISDFGKFVKNGNKWDASNQVTLTIPLSQNYVPQSIDCTIEVVASDLHVASSPNVVTKDHLILAGCNLAAPVSLATAQPLTCVVDKDTRQVTVTISLVGLDKPATRNLNGTVVISSVNGT